MKTPNPLNDKVAFPRQDPEIPWETSTALLTDPKSKNSGTFRRTLMRSRARVIEMPTTPRRSFDERLQSWVRKLDVVQLSRRAPRYARAVRQFEAELTKHADGRFHDSLQLALFDAWSHYNAVIGEAKRRNALVGN